MLKLQNSCKIFGFEKIAYDTYLLNNLIHKFSWSDVHNLKCPNTASLTQLKELHHSYCSLWYLYLCLRCRRRHILLLGVLYSSFFRYLLHYFFLFAVFVVALILAKKDEFIMTVIKRMCQIGRLSSGATENAGLENVAPDCRGGKRGSSTVWKAEVSVI